MPLQASDGFAFASRGAPVGNAPVRPVIVVSIWFTIERPPEAVVEGDISGDLPLVCHVEFEVMPLNVSGGVDAVFADVEHLRLVARSGNENVGKQGYWFARTPGDQGR